MLSKIDGMETYENFVKKYATDKTIGKSFRLHMATFMESPKLYIMKCSVIEMNNLKDGYIGEEYHFLLYRVGKENESCKVDFLYTLIKDSKTKKLLTRAKRCYIGALRTVTLNELREYVGLERNEAR